MIACAPLSHKASCNLRSIGNLLIFDVAYGYKNPPDGSSQPTDEGANAGLRNTCWVQERLRP